VIQRTFYHDLKPKCRLSVNGVAHCLCLLLALWHALSAVMLDRLGPFSNRLYCSGNNYVL